MVQSITQSSHSSFLSPELQSEQDHRKRPFCKSLLGNQKRRQLVVCSQSLQQRVFVFLEIRERVISDRNRVDETVESSKYPQIA